MYGMVCDFNDFPYCIPWVNVVKDMLELIVYMTFIQRMDVFEDI